MSTWAQLEEDLAGELPVLGELETILWKARGRCVQLQQTRLSLGLSVVSNEYLPREHSLTAEEERQLEQWGWQAPDAGDSNWYIELVWPLTAEQGRQAAQLLCRTMRLVLGVAEPADIDIKRFFAYGADPRRRR